MDFETEKLKKLILLENILPSDYSHLLNCIGGYKKEYPKSEYIVFEGEQLNNIGAVMGGSVHMIKEDLWGDKSIISVIREGDIFGESIVCGGLSNSIVSFQADENCEILFMPFKQVLGTCSRSCVFHQQMVENMVSVIAKKNIALMEKTEIISKKTIRARILCYLAGQLQRISSPYFECPMGRLDLADYLCVDRSALTRELTKMRDEGIIDYDKNTFYIKKV